MNRLFTRSLQATLFLLLFSTALFAKKDGWKFAIQSYSFHTFSLVEALDKCNQLGIQYIEVYPGHRLGGQWGDQVFGIQLDKKIQDEIKALAKQKNVKIVATGVFTSDDPQEWDQLFLFAKQMGLEYVTCEPPLELWDRIEALSNQYKIKVAVHNHPQPSTYWKPQALLQAIDGRSKHLGSCADVGHWKREGLDNIQCLQLLKDRVISYHFKDIIAKPQAGEQHDCIWGEGVLNVKGMIDVMRQQKFRGYLAIEYEYNWENSVPDIRRCLENFQKLSR